MTLQVFELSWEYGAYRVSAPVLLAEGERRKVVELDGVLDLLEDAWDMVPPGSEREPEARALKRFLVENNRLDVAIPIPDNGIEPIDPSLRQRTKDNPPQDTTCD